jgi:hypothetical protein
MRAGECIQQQAGGMSAGECIQQQAGGMSAGEWAPRVASACAYSVYYYCGEWALSVASADDALNLCTALVLTSSSSTVLALSILQLWLPLIAFCAWV